MTSHDSAGNSATAETGNADGSSTSKQSREGEIQQALGYLDNQYQNMAEKQRILLQMYEKLRNEEASLSKALSLTKDQPKAPQRPKRNDTEAVRRLQEALLASDDDEDDEEDDNDSLWFLIVKPKEQ